MNGQCPHGQLSRVCRDCELEAELAALREQLAAWEKAADSYMVCNWIGVYEKERGPQETFNLCVEKALDVERNELRKQLSTANAKLARVREIAEGFKGLRPLLSPFAQNLTDALLREVGHG